MAFGGGIRVLWTLILVEPSFVKVYQGFRFTNSNNRIDPRLVVNVGGRTDGQKNGQTTGPHYRAMCEAGATKCEAGVTKNLSLNIAAIFNALGFFF